MTFRTNIQNWLKSLLSPSISHRLAFAATLALLAGAGSASAQTATCTNPGANTAQKWKKWECVLEVNNNGQALSGRNPYLAQLKVTYTRGATVRTGYAAWDGVGANGKHRFLLRQMFPLTGTWTFTTACEAATYGICGNLATTPSLNGATGTIGVTNVGGLVNDVYRFGQLKVRGRGWFEANQLRVYGMLTQAENSAEFPWIGDSAWAAPMRATTAEWDSYLTNRAAKGVSVVHIGPATYWAGSTDTPDPGQSANPPFTAVSTGSACATPKPNLCEIPNMNFWRRFEGKIETANQKGLHVFLAGMMEPVGGPSGSRYPTTQEAIYFSRWLAARLAGNHVIFSPGFDSPYLSHLQKPVGAAIKAVVPKHLVTNHWNTTSASNYALLHNEPWLDFQMVQSGHNNGHLPTLMQRARELPWQISGASNPGVSPFNQTRKPTVNGEAIYDQGGAGGAEFSRIRARQAGFMSWLSGSFGYTWGIGGLWDWGACGSSSSNICGYQMASGFRSPTGALGQQINNDIQNFSQLLRTRISFGAYKYMDVYEQNRILNQASDSEQHKKMVLARNPEWILAYLPFNPSIQIRYAGSNTVNLNTARWWDPKTNTIDLIPPANRVCDATQCTFTNIHYNSGDVNASDRVLIVIAAPPTTPSTTHSENLEVMAHKTSRSNSMSIQGQLLNAAGEPIGTPVTLSPSGVDANDPAVGRTGNGKFFVAWQADTDANGASEIWGKWHVISGPSYDGKAFRISPADDFSTGNSYSHGDPSVAVDANGKVVVSWTRVGSEEANSEVVARQVGYLSFGNTAGNELGTFETLCSGADLSCFNSKAVANSEGKISIAWVEEDLLTTEARVVYQPFSDTYLLPLTLPQQANTTEDIIFWLSNLHADNSGNVRVEFEGRFGDRSAGLFQQEFNASGLKLGSEVAVNPPYPEG